MSDEKTPRSDWLNFQDRTAIALASAARARKTEREWLRRACQRSEAASAGDNLGDVGAVVASDAAASLARKTDQQRQRRARQRSQAGSTGVLSPGTDTVDDVAAAVAARARKTEQQQQQRPEHSIRITLFNEAVDQYQGILTPGATCFFSGGSIKRAFASNGGEFEISFGKGSDIHPVPQQMPVVPAIASSRIQELVSLAAGSAITTFAVIHAVGSLKRIATRKGKSLEKRELLLVDDSDAAMVCTTWGHLAYENGDLSEGTVVIVNTAMISNYNNLRSASIGIGSATLHKTALPRADELRQWYTGLPADHSFAHLALT